MNTEYINASINLEIFIQISISLSLFFIFTALSFELRPYKIKQVSTLSIDVVT